MNRTLYEFAETLFKKPAFKDADATRFICEMGVKSLHYDTYKSFKDYLENNLNQITIYDQQQTKKSLNGSKLHLIITNVCERESRYSR